MLPKRKRLGHTPPSWVPDDSLFFITICCKERKTNTLAKESIAKPLFDTIVYRQQIGHWSPHLFLLMPDHLHALISFARHCSMQREISSWKRFTAKSLKIEWQDGFFDHRIRNEAELEEKWSYVSMNPVRAGLCDDPTKWSYFLK